MKCWVKFPIHLEVHSRLFVISRRSPKFRDCMDLVREHDSPYHLEAFFRVLLTQARPELEEATIWMIDFDGRTAEFIIGVEHPSFPAVEPGTEIPREVIEVTD